MSSPRTPLALTALAAAFAALAAAGCAVDDARPFAVPVSAVASGAGAPIVAAGWSLDFDVARVGLGPVVFCATAAASADLCPAALAEYATSTTVDLLAGDEQALGDGLALPGAARSMALDYGVSHLATWSHAKVTAGAPWGHSAIFRGRAHKGVQTLAFALDLDLPPPRAGARRVQGAKVALDFVGAGDRLELAFDLAAWWQGVDFDAAAAAAPLGVVAFQADSSAANAVALAMTANALPKVALRR